MTEMYPHDSHFSREDAKLAPNMEKLQFWFAYDMQLS